MRCWEDLPSDDHLEFLFYPDTTVFFSYLPHNISTLHLLATAFNGSNGWPRTTSTVSPASRIGHRTNERSTFSFLGEQRACVPIHWRGHALVEENVQISAQEISSPSHSVSSQLRTDRQTEKEEAAEQCDDAFDIG